MSQPNDPTSALIAAVVQFVAALYPGQCPEQVQVKLAGGKKISLPVLPCQLAAAAPPPERPFVPSPFQRAILEALKGRALRTDALAAKVGGDRRRLFRDPGGLRELEREGRVAHHDSLGFYRPDAPPPELAVPEENG